ncbi:MAG: 2-hydroxyglutaryl-CoA dehydratase [Chloroflexi bacterium]|nr:2-hydroxyglutaryl-CoA dehydratase [Chloroflexota bacterium]
MSTARFLGIDIGSLTVKAVLLDASLHVLTKGVVPAGYGGQEAAEALVTKLLRESHTTQDRIAYTVVTGYGRVRFVAADEEISEISCHARGAFQLCPQTRTVIDVGGQDSKVIRLDTHGRVLDFAMNDKCAAGTGRFLEVMAAALTVRIEEFGPLALGSKCPVSISSTCTVFAESEAISHIARGAAKQDVAAGLHQAIASRILGLATRVGLDPHIVLTGGVALNVGMVAALEQACAQRVTVPGDPQTIGALGAALHALQRGKGVNNPHELSGL